MTLTTTDIEDVLADPRHGGWGWAQRRYLTQRNRHNAEVVLLLVANEEGWTKEQLFVWADSKYGRWLTDRLMGNPMTQAQMRADEGVQELMSLKGLDQ